MGQWISCAFRVFKPSIFASLLDPDRGGQFSIHPEFDGAKCRQLYLPEALTLKLLVSQPYGSLVAAPIVLWPAGSDRRPGQLGLPVYVDPMPRLRFMPSCGWATLEEAGAFNG